MGRGLVDRYGSKLPLIIGPLITAAGFAMFMVPEANGQSFWTGFFPAIMVMSMGMSTAVAPLTTTVMGAVAEQHAGVASGINNAVSRAAALIAVAVFGSIMLAAFSAGLAKRLTQIPINDDSKQQILSRKGDLVNIKMPSEIDVSRGRLPYRQRYATRS